MAVEHAMFKFGDLKVTSRDDRMTDRMTTKVHSSRRPRSSAARPKISLVTRQEWLLTRLFLWTGYGSGCLLVTIVKVVV